jgi:hypothetical protein
MFCLGQNAKSGVALRHTILLLGSLAKTCAEVPVFGGLSEQEGVRQSPGTTHIAWGVGTLQRFPISRRYSRARRLMDLVGSRDYGDRHFPWVPCVSCMAEGFDDPPAPEHDVVFYYHGGKTESQGITIPDDMPRLGNDRCNLDEAARAVYSVFVQVLRISEAARLHKAKRLAEKSG